MLGEIHIHFYTPFPKNADLQDTKNIINVCIFLYIVYIYYKIYNCLFREMHVIALFFNVCIMYIVKYVEI